MEQYFLLSVIAIILIIIIIDVAVILAQWKNCFFFFIGTISSLCVLLLYRKAYMKRLDKPTNKL
jgi:hypothetical protein